MNKYCQLLFFVISLIFSVNFANAEPQRVSYVVVDLVSPSLEVEAGQEFTAGWLIKPDAGWHVYYKNAGDTGLKTKANWDFAQGEIGEVKYPAPIRIDTDGIINYGYEHEVLLMADAVVGERVKAGENININSSLEFLMCKDICLPGEATSSLQIAVGEAKTDARMAAYFKAKAQEIPRQISGISVERDKKNYYIFSAERAGVKSFIPDEEDIINDGAAQMVENGVLVVARDEYQELFPAKLSGVLEFADGGVFAFESDVIDRQPPPVEQKAAEAAAPMKTGADLGFGIALIFALIAGMTLNLMPCVLPVLALKVLALVRHAHGAHSAQHGVMFTAGVVASFGALASGLMILRDGGAALGWGFHLQEPLFVAGLSTLLVLLALMFFGVFEIGTALTRLEGSKREGLSGAFLSGVLVTVVATPCTVPFMGGAVAFALAQPAGIGLSVFLAMGVGLALPYLLVSIFPKLAGFLPKPGAWMVGFRQFLGFPMLATALWLLWVYDAQVNDAAAFYLAACLMFVSFAAWVFGKWHVLSASGTRKWMARILMVASLVLTALVVTCDGHKNAEIEWREWSEESVAEALNDDHAVFVNFTADWCITCKANDLTTLSSASVAEIFAQNGVVAFEGDWTKRDAKIAAELEKFGRNGVPLYLFNNGSGWQVLPQILSIGVIRDAVEAAN